MICRENTRNEVHVPQGRAAQIRYVCISETLAVHRGGTQQARSGKEGPHSGKEGGLLWKERVLWNFGRRLDASINNSQSWLVAGGWRFVRACRALSALRPSVAWKLKVLRRIGCRFPAPFLPGGPFLPRDGSLRCPLCGDARDLRHPGGASGRGRFGRVGELPQHDHGSFAGIVTANDP